MLCQIEIGFLREKIVTTPAEFGESVLNSVDIMSPPWRLKNEVTSTLKNAILK